ncbi:ribosome biogenesis protein NOP53-like [Hyalella azteca]|uniref:Ribosome biogenesis protein NOP53 n=1 Tax=Hyalella azteca TaxID=294128 RepID=A0A8B7NR37_HYAAZ|nr:ribosome biogenesis protein NOP53-like [Hyalella azteca]
MTSTTLNLVEQVSSKKKKLNKSKNGKKKWRKHIDVTGIEAALEQQEEERLGGLGEVTSNFMYLDTEDGAADSTKENQPEDDQTAKKKLPTLRLEYTVDSKTGLKATDRPKSDKLIPELQLQAGLPGSKGPFTQSRFREKDAFLHQVQQKTRHSKNQRTAHKALVKAANSFTPTKSFRKIIKSKQKLSFDKNLWSEAPVPSREDELSAEAITHMKLSLGQQPINNRSSKIKGKNIPAVPLPHPGLSYNPDLVSHQKLVAKSVKSEMSRSKQAKYTNDMRTCDYPKGAEIVDNKESIRDMEAVHANTPASKEKPMEDEDEASVSAEARKMDRRTHAQRLKYRRHHEAIRLAKRLKDKKKRENAILRSRFREKDSPTSNPRVESYRNALIAKLGEKKNLNVDRSVASFKRVLKHEKKMFIRDMKDDSLAADFQKTQYSRFSSEGYKPTLQEIADTLFGPDCSDESLPADTVTSPSTTKHSQTDNL